jgi:hypothetical protein
LSLSSFESAEHTHKFSAIKTPVSPPPEEPTPNSSLRILHTAYKSYFPSSPVKVFFSNTYIASSSSKPDPQYPYGA